MQTYISAQRTEENENLTDIQTEGKTVEDESQLMEIDEEKEEQKEKDVDNGEKINFEAKQKDREDGEETKIVEEDKAIEQDPSSGNALNNYSFSTRL